MPDEIDAGVLDAIKLDAVSRLSEERKLKTNLLVDRRIYEPGDEVGPRNQRFAVRTRTVVVFADDDPRANWGHECRYLLYDAESGDLLQEVPARLPSGKLELFFSPLSR